MTTHATTWFGVLSSAESTLSVGYAVIEDADGKFLVATSANRATYGRSYGIAITAADATSRGFEYQVAGVLGTDVTGLGAGSATWVIVGATGALERDSSPDSGDDVIGKCNARGDVFVAPGVWDETNTLGGGGVAPAGSDGDIQVKSGDDLAALASTGTGNAVRENTPTLVTPVVGVATGTSVAVSSFLSVGASPAAAGQVRLSSNAATAGVFVRNAGGTADINLISEDTSGSISVGHGTNADAIGIKAATVINSVIGASTIVSVTSSHARLYRLALQDSDNSASYLFSPANLAADRTLTLPLLTGNDEFTFNAHAQTLTNKTISLGSNTLTFTSAQLRTACSDESGTGALLFADGNIGAATGTSLVVSSHLGVGATVATTGGVRMANNVGIHWRNAANSANLVGIVFDGSDNLIVGDASNPGPLYVLSGSGQGTNYGGDSHNFYASNVSTLLASIASTGLIVSGAALTIGTGPAAAGTIRIPNNTTALAARNAANSADLPIVATNGSDQITFGGSTIVSTIHRADGHAFQTAAGAAMFTIISGGGVSIGATTASVGSVRCASSATGGVYVRNAADTLDIPLCASDAGENIYIGHATGSGSLFAAVAGNIVMRSPTFLVQSAGGAADRFGVYSTGLQIGGGAADHGGGTGVIGIDNATTAPTTNPTSGVVLYVDPADGHLKYRHSGGTIIDIWTGL